MPKRLLALLLVAFTFSLTALLGSTDALAQTKDEGSWTGEVVDLGCYVTKGLTGASNKECVVARDKNGPASVKNGQPMGLLTDDGTLVLLAADHKHLGAYETLRDLVGERTQVEGTLAERDGMKVVMVKTGEAAKQ